MPRQSLELAARKAEQQAKINQAGQLGSAKTDFFNEDELNTVDLLVGEFIKRVKNNLIQEKMMVTGKIADITIEKVENGINILAHPWLIYQDKGVNGSKNKSRNNGVGYTNKRPPVQIFIDWINEKNIQARHNEEYHGDGSPFKEITNDEAIKRMAYAMREKVFQQGLKARNVYSKEIPKLIDDISKGVADFTVREILNGI